MRLVVIAREFLLGSVTPAITSGSSLIIESDNIGSQFFVVRDEHAIAYILYVVLVSVVS
jgi:hypothetical protein